jgi:hypothetical protein
VKTHLLLKIVPVFILLGTAAIAQAATTDNAAVQQQVAQIVKDGGTNAAKIAQLTADLVASSPDNIKNAAEIIAAVEKTTGINGEDLAAAVGRKFQSNPDLAAQAPAIAKALVSAILTKGINPKTQAEIAESVAILVTSLPGKTQANQQAINQIGKEVASVLSASHPEIAAEVVGITASVIKTSSGTSDVSSVVSSFADSFKTDSTTLNTKLDTIVTNVNAGQVYNSLPTSTTVINANNGTTTNSTSGLSSGAVTNPETKTTNG